MFERLRVAWLKWWIGPVTDKVTSSIDMGVGPGLPCEIGYYNSKGELVGYWAYGGFDPAFPYKGEY